MVPTRSVARRSITEGQVTVDGVVCTRPSFKVDGTVAIVVDESATRYVSRAGHKLAAAIDRFGLDLDGRTVLDVGSSTGGFTDCALQHGAARVVAVDVGTAQLHPTLHDDPRVTSIESTDVRTIVPGDVGAPFDLVVVDVSFIPLARIADALDAMSAPGTDLVVLIKPQFEVGRSGIGKNGVVKTADLATAAVDRVVADFAEKGFTLCGLFESPVVGGAGNHEYLAWLRTDHNDVDEDESIDSTCHTVRRG